MIRQTSVAVMFALGLGCVPSAAAAQQASGAALVERQFEQLEAHYGVAALSAATGRLRDDGVSRGVLDVRAGVDVAIVARCDEQCFSLGLIVWGPDGAEVDRDLFANGTPLVRVPRGSGGRFTYEVRMNRCLLDCAYGVRSYDAAKLPSR